MTAAPASPSVPATRTGPRIPRLPRHPWTLPVLVAAAGLLVAGAASVLTDPPGGWTLLAVTAALTGGAGLALAGVAGLEQRPDAGRPVALSGLLVLLAPVLAGPAGGWAPPWRAAGVAAALGLLLTLPWGLVRVARPERGGPREQAVVRRATDLLVPVLGLAGAAGAALDLTPVWFVAGCLQATGVGCVGWYQFERSTGDERRRVLWLVLGGVALPLGSLYLTMIDPTGGGQADNAVLVGLLALPFPAGLAVALGRPRAVDVRPLISRIVVLVTMTLLALACYVGVMSTVQALLGDRAPSFGVAGVGVAAIALAYHPVKVRMQVAVDELLFGGSPDAIDAVGRLGSQLSAGSSPAEWLEVLREALAMPAAAVRRGDEDVATAGPASALAPGAAVSVTPLRVGDEQVGELVLALPGELIELPGPARTVVRLVAGPLAQALHATALSEQLRSSRGRLVTAIEEERRRLRRDLHDGLGPTLSGIAYSADAAANLTTADPDAARELLRQLRSDAGDAITEIRRIVEGLRPRALDELGLVGALRQRTLGLHSADGGPLEVSLEAPDPLPALPAAVEVVAYRVVVEAVTNVARHAAVDRAEVRIEVDDEQLRLAVRDPGTGEEPWRSGVGLHAMRERVEAVGGRFTVERGESGTAVLAAVPLSGGA